MTTSNVQNISGDTVPASYFHRSIRAAVLGGQMLTRQNNVLRFDQEAASDYITGLGLETFNWTDTFSSEEEAVNAIYRLALQQARAQNAA